MDSITFPLQGCTSAKSMLTKETACPGGPEPDCALGGEMPTSLATVPAYLTLSAFCAPGQTQASRGFVRKKRSFHWWPKSGTSAEVWIGEKATDGAALPV